MTALGVALAGCDKAAQDAEDTAVVEEVDEVTAADGTAFTPILNSDGAYQDTHAAGTVTERDTWEDRPNGTTCFDPEARAMGWFALPSASPP